MSDTLVTTSPRTGAITIRSYRPADHGACRQLWAELTEQDRSMYEETTSRGVDPGAAFEDYLTRLDLSGMWVAEDRDETVIGFVGLLLDGQVGEVEPIVVTPARRGEGVGRALLGRVTDEGRRRGLRELSISPRLRNIEALHCLYAAGFDAAAALRLTLDLSGRQRRWRDGIDLHGLRLRY